MRPTQETKFLPISELVNYNGEYTPPLYFWPDVNLNKIEFDLVKETPKGYWISDEPIQLTNFRKIWVSKTAKKRYAYPSEKEALNSFFKRKESQCRILKNRLEIAEIALHIAKQKLTDNDFK